MPSAEEARGHCSMSIEGRQLDLPVTRPSIVLGSGLQGCQQFGLILGSGAADRDRLVPYTRILRRDYENLAGLVYNDALMLRRIILRFAPFGDFKVIDVRLDGIITRGNFSAQVHGQFHF